jgi:hypothetical protein
MAVAVVDTTLRSPLLLLPAAAHDSIMQASSSLDFEDFFNEVSDEFTVESSTESSPSRKVTFDNQVNAIPSMSPLDILDDVSQLGALWYGVLELDNFRTEVRELCRQMRQKCTAGPDSKVCTFSPCTGQRGLEQRSCLERQRRKYLTIKCVVRGQQGLSQENLAQLSLRCTKWATELAHEEARRDFVAAYNHDAMDEDDAPAEGEQLSSSSDGLKRTGTGVAADELLEARRVRPRLAILS